MTIQLFKSMLRIRLVEEAIAAHYKEQKMRCPVHLSIGQEAPAAILGSLLTHRDLVFSTHRAHAHYLAKGGDLTALIAELYGKASGCCGGRGGSMHLTDREVGFVASTAIVANSIPLAVGSGLALQLQKKDAISCVFFGDAATEEGAFYEAANFAALKRLPVLMCCENNLYSVYTPLFKRQPRERDLCTLARALGLLAYRLEGKDVLSLYQQCQGIVTALRQGGGPVFLEWMTYRWHEHCGPDRDDALGYRPAGEADFWQARDPLLAYQRALNLSEAQYLDLCATLNAEIDAAFSASKRAPFPDQATLFRGIYSAKAS